MLGAAPVSELQTTARIVVHVDLDCFYCQVEQVRLGIPRSIPCAVQQWEGLIAVNYAARAAGVTRHMRVQQAKAICPQLRLVHVQTIGGDDASDGVEVQAAAQSRGSAKACLQRYRQASARIMALLQSLAPQCPFEKASIDEAYLDITSLVGRELQQLEEGGAGVDGPLHVVAAAVSEASVLLGGPLDLGLDYDRRLAVGGTIASRMRAALAEQHQYTCSAGVAANKLLAKIASARNKPNKQTLVLPRAVADLMQALPLGKVKGLGGKLGALLQGLGAETCGQVAALPYPQLAHHIPDKARWVSQVVRGMDEDPVLPRDKVKSINSCKSFEATSDAATISRWLGVLAQELAERCAEDEQEHGRQPRSLVLQYRGGLGAGAKPDRSIRGPMPPNTREGPNAAFIAAAAMALFKKLPEAGTLPVFRLALSATEFVEQGAASGAAMERFLQLGRSKAAATAAATAAAAQTVWSPPVTAAAGPAQPGRRQQQHPQLGVPTSPGQPLAAEKDDMHGNGLDMQAQQQLQQCEQHQQEQEQEQQQRVHGQHAGHQQQHLPAAKRAKQDISSFMEVLGSSAEAAARMQVHQRQQERQQLPPQQQQPPVHAYGGWKQQPPTQPEPAGEQQQQPLDLVHMQDRVPAHTYGESSAATADEIDVPVASTMVTAGAPTGVLQAAAGQMLGASRLPAPAPRPHAPAEQAVQDQDLVDLTEVDVQEQARILQQLQAQHQRQQQKGQPAGTVSRGQGRGARSSKPPGDAKGNAGKSQRRLTDMLKPDRGQPPAP